jgi:hypothetical protein
MHKLMLLPTLLKFMSSQFGTPSYCAAAAAAPAAAILLATSTPSTSGHIMLLAVAAAAAVLKPAAVRSPVDAALLESYVYQAGRDTSAPEHSNASSVTNCQRAQQ